ncbi:hypothetical protein HY440_00685 [Candidatus Microgenomates bacterium]|nr:hypothetical protein [Candidatus Microgenomates bacterium]
MIKVLVFLFAVFLLFYRLDSPLLWQDEGEVALIAKNITKFGLPVAYDGRFLVTQEEGQDSQLVFGQRLWSWNTWLPYYATALSFKVFGQSTTAARLPFAVAGVGVLAVSYLLARKMKIHHAICLLVLATNVLFYLYSRQARYYALSMLFPLCAVYFFFTKRYWLYFLALLASFHSNFVLAFGLNLPLLALSLRKKQTLLFLAQSLLWLWFFHPAAWGSQPGFFRYWQGLTAVLEKFTGYVNLINSFYFPLVLAAAVLAFKRFNPILKVLLIGTVIHIAVVSFFLQFGQRNLVTLIPIFALFIAAILDFARRKNFLVFLLLLPLFVFTNLPNIVSERVIHPSYLLTKPTVRFYLFDYVSSLPKPYPGPLEGISGFLVSEGIKDTTLVYTDYEINSLRFYFPNLRFVDHPSEDVVYWLPRHSWGYLRELTICQKQLLESQAQKIILPGFDTQWENMPDITYHQFTIDPNTPPVTIYKVVKAINWKQCP